MTEHYQTIAYADCFSGASGDMFLGALIAAGLPMDHLQKELAKLSIGAYDISTSHVSIAGIQAVKLNIKITEQQPYRTWLDIKDLIATSGLSTSVKKKALLIFQILAEAEAKVHGCPVDQVHFHEVGCVDALIDIVGAAIGLDYLHINTLICSPLPMPRGFVRSEHGMLPLPAPAVCEILHDVPVYGVDFALEMVTPTGAAILKAMSSDYGPFPGMRITHTGYGAGFQSFPDDHPNLLRLVVGEQEKVKEEQTVEVIETNLDDWSPEGFPFLCEKLLTMGALDVSLIPMHMKKGRPGFLLRVITPPALGWQLKRSILNETSAIGLRYRQEQRWTLPRQTGSIPTKWGSLQVKKVETPDGPVLYAEYEACRKMAEENGLSLKKVYQMVAAADVETFTIAPSQKDKT